MGLLAGLDRFDEAGQVEVFGEKLMASYRLMRSQYRHA